MDAFFLYLFYIFSYSLSFVFVLLTCIFLLVFSSLFLIIGLVLFSSFSKHVNGAVFSHIYVGAFLSSASLDVFYSSFWRICSN